MEPADKPPNPVAAAFSDIAVKLGVATAGSLAVAGVIVNPTHQQARGAASRALKASRRRGPACRRSRACPSPTMTGGTQQHLRNSYLVILSLQLAGTPALDQPGTLLGDIPRSGSDSARRALRSFIYTSTGGVRVHGYVRETTYRAASQ
jgi:hypothetical protein